MDAQEKSLNDQFSTFLELLSYRAKHQPDKVGYVFLERGEKEEAKLTYGELQEKAKAIAAKLQSLIAKGDRALLLYSSGLEFITAFFGCLYAGVVGVPAYPPRRNQKMTRLQTLVKDAEAKVALTTSSLVSKMETRFNEDPEFQPLHYLATDVIENEPSLNWQEPQISGDSLAFLQYTSGSTGTPKGVMINHTNLLHNEQMIALAFAHHQNSIGLGWLPLFHDMGLIGNVLQPLYSNMPVILMSPMDFLQKPHRWLQAISNYKATSSGGPNFAYDLCIRKITDEQLKNLDLSSWELAFTGAEPVRAETVKMFAEKFEVCGFHKEAFYPCYGMAETTLFVTGGLQGVFPKIEKVTASGLEQNRAIKAGDREEDSRSIVSCGKTWLEQKIAIVNPESLNQCQPDQVGEIWVSGLSVAQGYWNRPLETEETFKAYIANTKEGPFLRTGDLGFIKNDELYVTGRVKDIIIIRGQNYYPQDIELTVDKSDTALVPGCGAAFAVGINNSERLVVVHEVQRNYLRNLNINEVTGNIREAVMAEHGLQLYAVLLLKSGTIPKTSSGKIQRHACRAGFNNGSLSVVGDWSENPQHKTKFLELNSEIQFVLQKLQTDKPTISNPKSS